MQVIIGWPWGILEGYPKKSNKIDLNTGAQKILDRILFTVTIKMAT